MTTVQAITDYLDQLAPAELAESWDNVGLLVGDASTAARRIMTCLTVTSQTVAEAIDEGADLIITHHPLPFRPLKRLTTATAEGRYLLDLIAARVAVYSAHTAFDSAAGGINERLAAGLALEKITALVPHDVGDGSLGSGRFGQTSQRCTLADLAARLKEFLAIDHLRRVGDLQRTVERVAVACGSAGEFLPAACDSGCDVLVTGETSFHTCLAAEAEGVALLLTGHYASERFAMERLADELAKSFSDVTVWASRNEQDPLHFV